MLCAVIFFLFCDKNVCVEHICMCPCLKLLKVSKQAKQEKKKTQKSFTHINMYLTFDDNTFEDN